MMDFIEYVVGELKSKRLSKSHALALIEQFSGRPSAAGAAVLHPLLHRNTSDLTQQGYTCSFTGSEFFLRDHRVHGKSVLPAVAYLEMIRAAMTDAVPETAGGATLELRNVVWAQPVVVQTSKDVRLALSVDAAAGDQIDFEIYSNAEFAGEMSSEVIHCQGQALFTETAAPARCDIDGLRAQMVQGRLDAARIYPAIAEMGIDLGPAQQGIEAIHQGERQQLVKIRLPEAVRDTRDDYVLHPSIMDSVLQAATGLLFDLSRRPDQPPIPFALDSLQLFSGCQAEMVAWARYAPGSLPTDSVVKLDIDLCDLEGNVCVSMRGFSSRVLSADIGASLPEGGEIGRVLAVPEWQPASAAPMQLDDARPAPTHVVLCDIPEVSSKRLDLELGKWSDQVSCRELKTTQQSLAGRYTDAALACFDTLRSLLQGLKGRAHVQLVITPSDKIFVGLSGLLKTASRENPNLVGQIVVTTPGVSPGKLARQLREAHARPQESIIRYEDAEPQVLRWRALDDSNTQAPTLAFKEGGVYLITGGLGGLGTLFAREILEKAADAKVILTGRSVAGAETQAKLDQLSAGASSGICYRQLDLADLDQVSGLLASVVQEFGSLDGIIHCAGMIEDAFILKKTAEAFRRVLEPKVAGAFNLDVASQDIDLDFLALFSGGAAIHGNPGQADYAAANGFMDQFAAYRNQLVAANARHGRTVSINWPLWRDGGMAIDAQHLKELQRSTGMNPMQTATGLAAFYDCLKLQRDQVLVVEGELTRIQRALLAEPRIADIEAIKPAAANLPVAMDASSLVEKTQSFLRKQFAVVLKMPAQRIDPLAPLQQYGIDSIVAMSLTNQLELTFGSLPKTLFFEYRSVHELTQHLIDCHADKLTSLFATQSVGGTGQQASKESVPEVAPTTAVATIMKSKRARSTTRAVGLLQRERESASGVEASSVQSPIAIVGLSGRYPQSIDIDSYWRNLRDGKDCITEVPEQRWSWRELYTEDRSKPGHHYSKWGGFIAGVDEFDPLFFGISPREARLIDPQERLFLQHAWMAFEDAGYTRTALQVPHGRTPAGTVSLPGQVGVYVGVMYGEYNLSGSLAGIANRVSSVMNFHGPSMALDTMCSSSLTAIHLACQDLKLGRTDVALAGGVNVSIHPSKYLMLSAGQFISSDGHCQSFGEGGDGYIPGEGVGAVVLKRLADAERDGDHIYGIIRGSALNHGGKTNGYTVPNPQAQASVIRHALLESNIDPRHVSYIEAHGTGTKLGDPIEIAALSKAFDGISRDVARDGACAIGSAKSNIGHCESAAGIAGLTKVLLQMQYRQIVPSLHSARLNPHIDFDRTPFVVNQSLRAWQPPMLDGAQLPRTAGISSFGAGGSNAHVIVEEYVSSAEAQERQHGQVIIPLSARTPEQLEQRARDLLDFIRARESQEAIDLAGMAYTLQAGREAMDLRLGFIVDSTAQLAERLEAYLASRPEGDRADVEGMCQGSVKDHRDTLAAFSDDPDFRDTIDKWMARGNLTKLLDVWVKGLELNWAKLYGANPPRRVSLPTYPFAREKYWIETVGQVVKSAVQPTAARPQAIQLNETPATEVASRATSVASKPKAVPLIGLQDLEQSQGAASEVVGAISAQIPALEAIEPLEQTWEAQETSEPQEVPAETATTVPSLSELQRQLSATLADALYMEVDDVDNEKSFVDLGLDSIVGVEWVKVINKRYGLALAATRVYDYPNIKELAAFLAKELAKVPRAAKAAAAKKVVSQQPAPANVVATSPAKPKQSISLSQATDHGGESPKADAATSIAARPSGTIGIDVAHDAPTHIAAAKPGGKIAIVGMSGRYPQANNLDQYWDNLAQGKNSIVEIPRSRWNVSEYFDADPTKPGKVYCKWLGMLDNVDRFDPLFFQISPAEAQAMDPQHRLFMQEAYHAFEDAGYSNTALSNVKCGVYLGIMSNEYQLLLARDGSINAAATGNSYAIGAARIAYHLNLKGPAIPIDTACSSSLVAIHLACQALLNREIDMALAGGVTLYLTPDSYLAMCQLGMLSPEGQCKTFDDTADGFVPGEGVGALVLKRLEDAEADHDLIHGVILGSAINQDGKTNGITAPSVSSQIELERDLYARHRIDPQTISYVETHGTGTKLGDPIELEALATVFGEQTTNKNFCALGSVKTNIGHTSGAAGVAGVQKVLLSMRHRTLAPSLNVTTENTLFDFESSPFYICRERQAWHAPSESLLRAAVSSFGFSGTNAHLVLEEYVPTTRTIQELPSAGGVAVVLSARTPAQLEQKAQDLLDFLQQSARQPDLSAVAYTLQVGREAFKERLGMVAGSVAQLIERLRSYLTGATPAEHVYRGQAGRDKDALASFVANPDLQETIARWLQQRKFGSLLDLWVKGLAIDWRDLYTEQTRPPRIGLPTYPFAEERYWPNVSATTPTTTSAPTSAQRLIYMPQWKAEPLPRSEGAAQLSGSTLLLDASDELFITLKKQLPADAKLTLLRLQSGVSFAEVAPDVFTIDMDREPQFLQLVDALKIRNQLPARVLHHFAAASSGDQAAVQPDRGFISLFHVCKALLANKHHSQVKIVSILSDATGILAAQNAALAGFFKTLAQESPRYVGKAVNIRNRDNAAISTADTARLLLEELQESSGSGAVEYQQTGDGARRYIRRVEELVPYRGSGITNELPLKQRGVYLVAGGLGGLGFIFCEYLARTYGARLVLLGRSSLTAAQEGKLRRLQAHQPEIAYVQTDVARFEAVAHAVQTARQRFGTVNGVIHAAGTNKDAFILKKTREQIDAVLSAKVLGAVNLDRATSSDQLDLFVMFSSVAATWGNAGQSDYAYANDFLDRFAGYREELRSKGERSGRSLSINWPFWIEGGMSLSSGDRERTQAQAGLSPLPTEQGLRLWEEILGSDLSRAVALYGDASKIDLQLAKAAPLEAAAPAAPAANLTELLAQAREYLQRLIAAEIKLPAEQVDPQERFEAFGIDSVVVGRMNATLARELGELPKTLFYEYETVEEFAQYLIEQAPQALLKHLGVKRVSEAASLEADRPQRTDEHVAEVRASAQLAAPEQIAIIGVHGYYPGCQNLDDYWRHLRDGTDLVGVVPADRWDAEALHDADPARAANGKIYCKSGAFLDGVDKFDAPFFNVAAEEATAIDPQERLFLSSVWSALEDAGYTRDSLKRRHPKAKSADVGVFVGVTTNSYQLLAADEWSKGNVAAASALPWSIANRVSYFFDFQGPSMPIDTACSSSLVALHLACEALQRRECQVAIAGGVNLYLHPSKYHSLCQRGMLATGGKCRSFGAGDDGFVPGEAVGALVLKPLSDAVRDGDHVYAVVAGSACDHSGRSNGYAAPNPNSQAGVIGRALAKADIHPDSISYIEGHGTGTQLGDSLEIAALSQAFGKQTSRRQFCPVGSVKANLGHAESAAGIAGLTKILLQMKHRQLVPSLHSAEVNPNIDFEASPCYLQHELSPWPESPEHPRRALINSFGAGGVNACVVLEEHRAAQPETEAPATGPYLIVLSARTRDRLIESGKQLLSHVDVASDIDLAALSFTLQVGREAMSERLALVVADVTMLKQQLAAFLKDGSSAGARRGSVRRETRKSSKNAAASSALLAARDLDALAKAWTAGEEIDWERLHGERPARVSLPTYPFSGERYWVTQSAPHASITTALNDVRLHPLVSHNSSTLKEVSFSSVLSSTEFYARDHKVNEQMIFPGAGFLEMARVAGAIGAADKVTAIKDVVWVQPVVFSAEPRLVQIALQPGDAEAQYTITSYDENHQKVVHAEGIVQFQDGAAEPHMNETHVPIEALKQQCSKRLDGAQYYDMVEKSGLSYGPAFRTVQELYFGESFALSRLRLLDELTNDFDEYVLHPSIIDGALQTVSGLLGGAEPSVPYLPFAIDEVQILRSTAPSCYVHVELAATESHGNAEVRKFNLQITNEHGLVLVKLKNFCVRAFKFSPASAQLSA